MQLNLFPWESLSEADRIVIYGEIRRGYWVIRNVRGRYQQGRRRKEYRRIAGQKKRLLLAGVEKREILEFLRCCRLQCSFSKHPFEPCRYCTI